SHQHLRPEDASGSCSDIHLAPRPPRASSSARPTNVNVPFGRGPCAILRVTAAWLAVINNMSTAPRPYNLPSSISASNGGLVHLGSRSEERRVGKEHRARGRRAQ